MFLKDMQDSKQQAMEDWANLAYVGDSAETSSLTNMRALGVVGTLQGVIDRLTEGEDL